MSPNARDVDQQDMPYRLDDLADEFHWTYGEKAPAEAVKLLVESHRRGLEKQFDVFASLAISLCYRCHRGHEDL